MTTGLENNQNYVRMQWNNFQRDVLIPTIVETKILHAKDAQSWNGGSEYNYGNQIFYIHNPCKGSWWSIPTYGFNYSPTSFSLFNFTNNTTVINENSSSHSHFDNRTEKKDKKGKDDVSTAMIVAGVGLSIVAILYTAYQMSYSIAQTRSSSRSFHEMKNAHEPVKYFLDSQNRIQNVVDYRTEVLNQAYNRNLADTIEDIVILAGLTLVAFGCALSYSAPLLASGTVIVVATIIAKFVTKSIWPNIADDEKLKSRGLQAAKWAQELMDEDRFVEIRPPSGPAPLYPNLDEFKAELKRDFNVNIDINFKYNPTPSAPPMGT